MSDTATMIAQAQNDNRLRYAMDHLLHKLRRFMRAYPMQMDDEMPDHDLVWVEEMRAGPATVIIGAIKANPVLWLDALPPEVCIVPREMLEKSSGLSPEYIEHLTTYGERMVVERAALYALSQRQIEERSDTGSPLVKVSA